MTKPKIIRVVTDPFAVKYHMHNTLSRIDKDFEVLVVGQNVSQFSKQYKNVNFLDLNISRKVNLVSDICAVLGLIKIIVKFKPNIIHSLMPKASLISSIAGFLCRVPVRLHTFTGQVWATKSGISRYTFRKIDWLVNSLNTMCLTDSNSQSNFLYDNGIHKNRMPLPILIHGSLSGVDLERFNAKNLTNHSSGFKSALKLDSSHYVFAYVARKTVDKGAIDMLEAFHITYLKYNQARLLFIGPDEDGVIDKLRSSSPYLFEGVIEIGSVLNHEMYLNISNVLCLPSHREGFGSIVIDAAALKMATIGTKIPGLVDAIVENETGILTNLGDIPAFADSMLSCIEDPARINLLGIKAKERVDSFFGADNHYSALKTFYLSFLN